MPKEVRCSWLLLHFGFSRMLPLAANYLLINACTKKSKFNFFNLVIKLVVVKADIQQTSFADQSSTICLLTLSPVMIDVPSL